MTGPSRPLGGPSVRWFTGIPTSAAQEDLRPSADFRPPITISPFTAGCGAHYRLPRFPSAPVVRMLLPGLVRARLVPEPDHSEEPFVGVVLSYSRKDQAAALAIRDRLVANDVDTWIDVVNILPGQSWPASIELAIRNCSHLVLLLSPNSVASPEVEAEWVLAKELGKSIVPVMLAETTIPFRLLTTQYIDCRQSGQDALLAQLLSVLPRSPRPKHFVRRFNDPVPDHAAYARIRVHDCSRPGRLVNDEEIYINPNGYGSLRSLLDEIYINYLNELVPPYTYGQRWLLKLQGPLLLAPMEWLERFGESVDKVAPAWLDQMRPVDYGFIPGSVAYFHHQTLMEDLRCAHRVFATNPLVVHSLKAIRTKCLFSDWLFSADFQVLSPSEIDTVAFPFKFIVWHGGLPMSVRWSDKIKSDSVLVYHGRVSSAQIDARSIEWPSVRN